LGNLLKTAGEGQVLRRGVRAAIIGRPNTGKSSLLNQLLGHDRAIVSPTPGTTRDTITEMANIRGFPVVFIDTAGLRESSCEIEQEGVRRSRESIANAEVLLHVLDRSTPWTNADAQLLHDHSEKKSILILNKQDLPSQLCIPDDVRFPAIPVSCLTGTGMEILKDKLAELVAGGQVQADMSQVMINSRHEESLKRAHGALEKALIALEKNIDLACVAFELRIAVNAVGEVVGKTASNDLLDIVFSQFCIGK
jgi:tRNA modification GTPase